MLIRGSVLLIPGVSTAPPDTWMPWLSEVLPSNVEPARVLAFEYTITLNENEFSCQDILLLGDTLLNALSDLRSQPEVEHRPLLVICHSVGGLVLKQTLSIANELAYRYTAVLGSVAGLVFLGTPHIGARDEQCLASLLTILAGTRRLKRPINLPEKNLARERAMLDQLRFRFENISLQVPILTIVETRKTKVYGGMLKSKNLIVSVASMQQRAY